MIGHEGLGRGYCLLTRQDRDPFVLVLIDGDGMIFSDDYIKLGEEGGRLAADELRREIVEAMKASLNVPQDTKVVARIYANVRKLGEACGKAGIISRSALLEDFARGFTGSKQLFDFVDVGVGKDRADDKLSGI